jgi:predicted secreted protein
VKTAQNHIPTQPRVRKAKAALVAAAALAGSIFAQSAFASDVTLTDGNNTVTINPGGQTGLPGVNSWNVNGVNYLAQEWYDFSVGNSAPTSLNALNTGGNPVSVTESDSRGLPGVDNTAKLGYTDPAAGFTATATYQLTGSFDDPPIKGDLTETLKITNTSSSTLTFHLYEYTNFQLDGTTPNNSLTITGGNNAKQTDPANGVYATVYSTPTSHSEAATASTLSSALGGSSPVTLNDNPTITNADAALGYEWDLSIAPGQSVTIGTDKDINSIPEPSSCVALAGVAAVMLGRRRTRRPIS